MHLLWVLLLYQVILGGVIWYLAVLFSHRSTWPFHQAFGATIMTVAAFTFSPIGRRGEFAWVLEGVLLFVWLPLALGAVVLWIYVLGRTIRGLWLAWKSAQAARR